MICVMFQFDTKGSVSFSSDHFKKNPSPSDKVHVMLVVVSHVWIVPVWNLFLYE